MQKILITGAGGFVGARLCQYFAQRNFDVLGVINSADSWRLAHCRQSAQIRVTHLDLTDAPAARALLLKETPDVVLNCAAFGAYSSQTDQNCIYAVNFTAVRTLLEASRELANLKAFIQMGSSSEYGANCAAPTETAPTLPDSHYAVSKVAASQLVQFYGMKHSVPAWTFRLYSVYGPYEDLSRLIPRALLAALNDKLPPLANPKISRDFVYIDDVCEAVEALLAKSSQLPKGHIYNIGSGVKTTLHDLVSLLNSALGVSEAPNWGSMNDRAWDHADWYSNPSKANTELGWSARTLLLQGLKTTQNWLKAHPELVKKGLENSVVAPTRK